MKKENKVIYSFYNALNGFLEEARAFGVHTAAVVEPLQELVQGQALAFQGMGEFEHLEYFLLTPTMEGKPDTKPCHLISAVHAQDNGVGFLALMEEFCDFSQMLFCAENVRNAVLSVIPVVNDLKRKRRDALLTVFHENLKETDAYSLSQEFTQGTRNIPKEIKELEERVRHPLLFLGRGKSCSFDFGAHEEKKQALKEELEGLRAQDRPFSSNLKALVQQLDRRYKPEIDDLKGSRYSITLPNGGGAWSMETFLPRLKEAMEADLQEPAFDVQNHLAECDAF